MQRAYLREFPAIFYVLSLCLQVCSLAFDCTINGKEWSRSLFDSLIKLNPNHLDRLQPHV